MTNLDSLIVEIKADLTDIRKNMKNAVKVTQESSNKITKSNEMLSVGFNKVRVAAIAAAAGIIYMGKQTLNEVDRIQKLGIRLDETTENLSRMKFVAEQSGIEFNTLAMAFQRMQRRVAEAAKGTGEAKDALKELGLSATQLNQMSVTQQFMRVTEAMNEVKNGADKTRLSMKLFDSEGVALIQIMNQGTQAMKQLAAETPNVITQADADRIATFNDNMNVLKKNIQGVMIPVLGRLAQKINKLFERSDEVRLRNLKMELDGIATKLELSERESSKAKHSFLNMAKSINKAEQDSSNYNKTLHDRKIAIQSEIDAIKKRAEIAKSLDGGSNIEPLPDKIIGDESVKGLKDDIKEAESAAIESSNVIKDAMIDATNQWSDRLTDAIVDGGNMFESLAEIAKRTAFKTAIVNPFIGAIQGGITGLMTPKPTTNGLAAGTNGITINMNNSFQSDVQASVRAELATAAPQLQAAAISGVQSAINNGKMRT